MVHKPKILGTGLSGLVGSRIIELLSPQYDFIDFSLDSGVDILNLDSLKAAFDANKEALVVLHLAAFTDTAKAWEQRGDKDGLCYRLNVEGTRNILNLCSDYKKHLIHISTDFVFNGEKQGAYTEADQPHPIEWYGQTKYLAEQLIQQSLPDSTIARIAFPYRAKFDPKPDIVRKILSKLENGDTVSMFQDQLTTPTFVDDIAQGLRHFIEKKNTGIFHLVGSSSQSPYDMAQLIASTFGLDKNLIKPSSLKDFIAAQPPDSRPWQKNLSLSNQKIRTLGLTPKTITEGLQALGQIKNL